VSDDGNRLRANGLRDAALALGLPREQVQQADADGTLELVALEHLAAGQRPCFDLSEVAARANLATDRVLAFWRALGFPDPRPGERMFTAADADMLAAIVQVIDTGALDQAVALQMAKVIGSSLNRIAAAQVDAVVSHSESGTGTDNEREPQAQDDPMPASLRSAHIVPLMPRILEMVWQRHLATAARRRIIRAAAGEGDNVCVGFADLVGFTARTRQLSDHELAEVVRRFETIAYDVVTARGGRVVKMIGDEVLFLHEDVRSGAELALALAAAFRRDEQFSDVRVALASGRVLQRDGDVFGAVVNLASRIVHVAFPGSVVVSQDVHDAVEHDRRFASRALRQHYLKDIGRVPLWSLRPALLPDEETDAAERLRELEAEAQRLAAQDDTDAERTLAEALHDARLRVEEAESQAWRHIEEALLDAEKTARKAGDQAWRKVAQFIDTVQSRVDAARSEVARRTGRR